MKRLGITPIACHSAGTIIHIAIDGKYMGHILISDVEKPTSKEAIRALKSAGIEKAVMLTGDAKRVADQVAEKLGLDEVYSELLPSDKVARWKDCWLKNRKRRSWHLWEMESMMLRYLAG